MNGSISNVMVHNERPTESIRMAKTLTLLTSAVSSPPHCIHCEAKPGHKQVKEIKGEIEADLTLCMDTICPNPRNKANL